MVEENKGANRYTFFLLSVSGNRYYYDFNLGTFVMMQNNKKDKPYKTTLHAIDVYTSNFDSLDQIIKMYNFDEQIVFGYISYYFKGERNYGLLFDKEWGQLAKTFGETKNRVLSNNKKNSSKVKIDYRLFENLEIFEKIYREFANLESDFANIIIKNKNKLSSLSNDVINTIIELRAHERAIKAKYDCMFGIEYDISSRDYIYVEDRLSIYHELRKELSDYNKLRTIYLNYCKYKAKHPDKIQDETKEKEDKPIGLYKEKTIKPPKQLSMFD